MADIVDSTNWDLIVVGGGAAGLPAAIFASERTKNVLVLDHADKLGGTAIVATGQMSAAGTKVQKSKGITDTAEEHYKDVIRISRGTANPEIVKLAVYNAADTIDWLMDNGFDMKPEHPILGFGHEFYSKPRYYWGQHWGISIVNVLVPLVEKQVKAGKLTVRMQHEVVELLQDSKGAVIGVVAKDADGKRHRIQGRVVALTSGGYAGDPKVFEEMNGVPQYTSIPYKFARGAGHRLGVAAGGYLRGQDKVFTSFGFLLEGLDFPAPVLASVNTFPERRQPWEIYVNARGERFVREDIPSVDAREYALMQQPHRRYWIIFNEDILNASTPVVIDWTKEQIRAAFGVKTAFSKADSFRTLASKIGIDADGLARSIDGYNYGVQTGHDFFGREHKPMAMTKGPYYAIRMQGGSIGSAVGLAVNDKLQVIREDGTPIPNLYAAGELLGASQTMGKAAVGGMMVTPALTLGRLLGQRMLPLDNGPPQ